MKNSFIATQPGIWMTMLLACTAAQAADVMSNTTTRTGFRIDFPSPSPAPFRCVLPRLAPPRLVPPIHDDTSPESLSKTNAVHSAVTGFQLNEGYFSSWPTNMVLVGPEPIRTVRPGWQGLQGLSEPLYLPTSLTNDALMRMDLIGPRTPVAPVVQDMPPSGTNSLGNILGPGELRHVFNALNGICGDDGSVAYERRDGQTSLTFETGLEIVVDDATGAILTPPGLPCVSDAALADLTWRRMEEAGDFAKWRARFQKTNENGLLLHHLAEIRLDEIYRVADKAFIAWRLVDSPVPEDGFFIRIVHWVDIPSGEIVHSGEEFNSRSHIIGQ